jgi:hypothetical protein
MSPTCRALVWAAALLLGACLWAPAIYAIARGLDLP